MDKKIAEIEGVDIVIGGHTNTFLYTGKKKGDFFLLYDFEKGYGYLEQTLKSFRCQIKKPQDVVHVLFTLKINI